MTSPILVPPAPPVWKSPLFSKFLPSQPEAIAYRPPLRPSTRDQFRFDYMYIHEVFHSRVLPSDSWIEVKHRHKHYFDYHFPPSLCILVPYHRPTDIVHSSAVDQSTNTQHHWRLDGQQFQACSDLRNLQWFQELQLHLLEYHRIFEQSPMKIFLCRFEMSFFHLYMNQHHLNWKILKNFNFKFDGMIFLKTRGHGHDMDNPQTRMSTELWFW